MSEVVTARPEEDVVTCMTDMASDLFKEWLFDLSLEEKEIWLWNSQVEMDRIKQRRPSAG